MVTGPTRRWHRNPLLAFVTAAAMLSLAGTGVAAAQGGAGGGGGGGTAKPPKGAVSPWVIGTLGDPAFSAPGVTAVHGFDDTGLVQAAGVDGTACPTLDRKFWGGSATMNGQSVVIPCNLVVQMPANTVSWSQFVDGSAPSGAVQLKDLELRLVGNTVGAQRIAGLAYVSQQSVNGGKGVITGFDYANGIMKVDNGKGGTVDVQLNDPVVPGLVDSAGNPTGRFSAGKSPDARFSVDQDNPTVHAATGYPMCVPRTDPTTAPDPLCPQGNRPLVAAGCRNFGQAAILPPKSGELTTPAGLKYCSQWVMASPAVSTLWGDARQQVPFEVGDTINFSGTRLTNNGTDYISAHTVEANLGVYTQPGTQPAYVAIGAFGVGTADTAAIAANGAAQETQNRIFLEAETTDVQTPVDIYYQDRDTTLGSRSRWVTPFEMTGENANTATSTTASGGITTQNTGPQPQRARLRATKAPFGLLSQPSRTVRVAQRSLCMPAPLSPTGTTIDQGVLDGCFAAGASSARVVANGLAAGQYQAPTFNFIFPENVRPGDTLVPNDLWHLPFLRNGEVGGVGALTPTPW